MSKVFKITIAIIIFLFSANMVLAADIDMNLTAEDTNSVEDANLIDTNTLDTNSIDDTNTVANETPTSPNDNIGGAVAPSGVSQYCSRKYEFLKYFKYISYYCWSYFNFTRNSYTS